MWLCILRSTRFVWWRLINLKCCKIENLMLICENFINMILSIVCTWKELLKVLINSQNQCSVINVKKMHRKDRLFHGMQNVPRFIFLVKVCSQCPTESASIVHTHTLHNYWPFWGVHVFSRGLLSFCSGVTRLARPHSFAYKVSVQFNPRPGAPSSCRSSSGASTRLF